MVARKTGATEPGSDWTTWMRWQWARPAPSHNAFWFGWRAAHPDTELVAGDGTVR